MTSRAKKIKSEADLLRAAGREDWAGVQEMVAEEVAPLDVVDWEVDDDQFTCAILSGTRGVYFTMRYPFTWGAFWDELSEMEQVAWQAAAEGELEDGVVSLQLERAEAQRLHVVIGSPGRAALGTYLAGEDTAYWNAPDRWAAGDLLLTILDVDPPMILCLERAARSAGPRRGTIEVAGKGDVFVRALIPKGAVDKRISGRPLPTSPQTLSNKVADEVLTALAEELKSPSPVLITEGRRSASTTRHRASGLQVWKIAQGDGSCECCGVDYTAVLEGRGIAALEVHHLDALAQSDDEMVDTDPDRLMVLCGSCHNLIHGSGVSDVDALRYALRPACPACDARSAREIIYGMVPGPLPEHMSTGGCVVEANAPQWECGSCGSTW